MTNSEPYLSARQLATRWSIPISTLRQWRWRKKGPASSKAEGRTIYYLKDIEAFEEECIRQHTTMASNPSQKSP